jgi:hypothetical protein
MEGRVRFPRPQYRDWSECDGDLETRWDKGHSLDRRHALLGDPPIMVPAAITLSNELALVNLPRSMVERVVPRPASLANAGRRRPLHGP